MTLTGRATLGTGEDQCLDAPALVALAFVHLQRNELREARGLLKQADAALGRCPDKLLSTAAYLIAAGGALAEGRAATAVGIVARARSGGPLPTWLDQQLSIVESRAWTAAGDFRAALAAAERAVARSRGHARAGPGGRRELRRHPAPARPHARG